MQAVAVGIFGSMTDFLASCSEFLTWVLASIESIFSMIVQSAPLSIMVVIIPVVGVCFAFTKRLLSV